LVFARDQKKRNNVTVPFTYLGPVDMVSYESDRPIKMVWRFRHLMPVEMFSYEKAARELPFLGFMFEMPIVVAGVGVNG